MEPRIAQKGPYLMELKAGTYYWCSCGHSQSQPFCSGAHTKLNTGMSPVEKVIAKDTVVAWCGCKRTGSPPSCDSTHNNL
jgi:CDGSH-type Zn-finger protein